MKILFNYATRSRRDNFLRGIDSIRNNVTSDNYHILVKVDSDDYKMHPLPYIDVPHSYAVGRSDSKIHAINRDIETIEDWDILVNMSDDMVFNQKGFDEVIRNSFFDPVYEAMDEYVINLQQFIHFPDGNRSDLCTMAIMGRDYYNRFGYVYHPLYVSLWCDNEQTEVAKALGCYKFIDTNIFEHKHPAYGKAPFDAQYQYTESFNSMDHLTYLKRKVANFGL